MINNKSILITGGTGSFGSLFVKYIVKNYKPKRLIIFSRDELKQYKMQQELPPKKYKFLRYFIGDIRDKDRLKIATRDVDILIHAAAMKQVDTSEYNPTECIKTNIYGTENLISAARENGIKKFLLLSTDKAVNPINLYGASKLAADKLVIAANNLSGSNQTRFSVVRYGNVINSRGSVIPYFRKLIKLNSDYLPITDFEMTRFWISLEQSVNFILSSLSLMRGGEIFVPKIPSAKIVDVAKSISKKIKLKEIGIRPGEKLHEILFSKEINNDVIEFKNYYVIKPSISFFIKNNIYNISLTKEKGKKVPKDFEYRSDNNKMFLKISDVQKIIKDDSL